VLVLPKFLYLALPLMIACPLIEGAVPPLQYGVAQLLKKTPTIKSV